MCYSEVFEIKVSDQPPSHLDLTERLSENEPCAGEIPGRPRKNVPPSGIMFSGHIHVLFPQLLAQLHEKIG